MTARRQGADGRPEWLQGLFGTRAEGARRSPGQGAGEISYRVTIPCTRAQGEAIGDGEDPFADSDSPPVVVADEPDESMPDDWVIHAYFEAEPSNEDLALLKRLGSGEPQIEYLED